jgi:hypothetical protein
MFSSATPASPTPPQDKGQPLFLQQTTPVVTTPVITDERITTHVVITRVDKQTEEAKLPETIDGNRATVIPTMPVDNPHQQTTPVETTPVNEGRPVHRATQAQDGHSHSEQLIYDILWRAGRSSTDSEYRIVQIPQSELARTVRMTTKNLRLALGRLVEKLSIEESQTFNRGTRVARQWKIFSYKAILERRRKAGMEWVSRDKGVRFVSLRTTGVITTPVVIPHSSVSTGVITTEITRVGAAVTTGVEATSPSLGQCFREIKAGKVPTSPMITRSLMAVFGHCDDEAVRLIVSECTRVQPDITEEEIVSLIGQHGPRFQKMRNIDNPMGMLIRHLPKCCEGETFLQFRQTESRKREAVAEQEAANRKFWQRVVDDPSAAEEDKKLARDLLALEGQQP